jgi:hypothetical protein
MKKYKILSQINSVLESLFLVSVVKPTERDKKFRIVRETVVQAGNTYTNWRVQYRWGLFWRWVTVTETWEFLKGEPTTEVFIRIFRSRDEAIDYAKSSISKDVRQVKTLVESYIDEYGNIESNRV